MSQAGPMMGFVFAAIAALLWPFRFVFGLIVQIAKKSPKVFVATITLLVFAGTAMAYNYISSPKWQPGPIKKVIVLGMDGLDPDILEKMMDQGELPHFQALRNEGTFERLQTVSPPQSPVAWSTFATGLNPGGHGMYDFLWRHTENYMPDLALSELNPAYTLNIFGKEIHFGNPTFKNRQKGQTLWSITSKAGVPTTVIHVPVTFPAEKVSGSLLAGMGVPDIRGTQGIYTFYSDQERSKSEQGGKNIRVRIANNQIKTFITGAYGEEGGEISVDLNIQIDPEEEKVNIRWEGGETTVDLEGWSQWARVEFPIASNTSITGMTRFHLKSLSPHFELYASAFNFTPENPVHKISYPNDYAKRLKDAVGDFHTLGMPHDTWALNKGAMTEEMFLQQSQTILDEEKKMLKYELPQFKEGLFVFVVETPDRIEHMFWRAIDPEHPLYTKEDAKKYRDVIPNTYRDMDEILGIVKGYVDEDTLLMVISDHGFKSFRRAVHINSWLRDQGYLVFKPGVEGKEGDEFFKNVDWSKSKAYAVGLGSIYLNIKGREKQGIVNPGTEVDTVLSEIAAKFKEFKDEKTGQAIVREVYRGDEIFSGEAISDAPDLLVGFEDGYRASWQTALGASPLSQIEDNRQKWSGDHILDYRLVPGIFFSNQRINKPNPSLYDLSPTILSLLGIEVPENQKGKALFLIRQEPV